MTVRTTRKRITYEVTRREVRLKYFILDWYRQQNEPIVVFLAK
jgi:hypothetical protein